jgi:hypothetical protein
MAFSPFSTFSLAINYPWLAYGEDFGCVRGSHRGVSAPPNQELLLREFSRIRETGATVVRWFLFGDGRGGFVSEDGIPREPEQFLFADVRAALDLATQYNLKLCLSLIDYLWLQEHDGKRAAHSHEHVLHFAAAREAFLLGVLIPLFREFRGHPALFAWELANEPEWAIREFSREPAAQLHFADFRAYASEIARAIHEFGNVPVTIGSARLMWVRAWSEVPVDFYQAHYYPSAERDTQGGLAEQLRELSQLDKPLWLGEIPARDASDAEYSLHGALEVCRHAGLSGAAIWRWTKPESQDRDLSAGQIDPVELKIWSRQDQSRVQSA